MDSISFVMFGATGDLAKRKIYPALYNLYLDKKVSGTLSVIGLGRRQLSDHVFQEMVRQSLTEFSRRKVNESPELTAFLQSFRYCALDIQNPSDYRKLLHLVHTREAELEIPENRMFYLSVAPEFFDVIALNIKESGLGSTRGWKRLIIEKPFGRDLRTARELNEKLSKAFHEDEIFRIDHFLGKPMVQNLEVLEYANPMLQSLWSNKHIANVQITASETVGVEERAGYYDKAGAIRDMFQNHMLQMLMMISMQMPKHSTPKEVRMKKRHIMQSLRPVQKEDIGRHVVRGQYGPGELHGKQLAGYTEEPGVTAASANDTFIAARLWIDDYFWDGVPFYLRTGKRLAEKSTRIVVEFKDSLAKLSHREQNAPNLLVIDIGPKEGISFILNRKDPKDPGKLQPVTIEFFSPQGDVPEAYENLIYDALRGDSTFFAHWDEVELSWKWVQPILEAFEENLIPLHAYEAGSNGPEAADTLLEEDGFHWWLDPEPAQKNNKIRGEMYA